MMAILKLQPRNLPGIEKHFAARKKEIKAKLASLNKKRVQLERELEVAEDGYEWCQNLYQANKAKAAKKQ